MQQPGVLGGLAVEVERSAGSGRRPTVVFDLDDTLLSTDRRHIRIVREFAGQRSVRARFLEDAWNLVQLEPRLLRYSITDSARAAGVNDPALLTELRAFWFARFFKNEYLLADEPVPGAPLYCRELRGRGARIIYLTGRDETMRLGTLQSLESYGFPVPDDDEVCLMLKPRFDSPDLEFKTASLRAIEELGAVCGAFENEPSHINLFHGAFPLALSVFVDTKHSGKPIAPHPAVHWIRDFRISDGRTL